MKPSWVRGYETKHQEDENIFIVILGMLSAFGLFAMFFFL